jgi:FkbM family methyltransferase
MSLASGCAGVLARGLSRAWPTAARSFGFWYRRQTVLHPRWCSPIEWEKSVEIPGGTSMSAPFGEIQGMSLILDGCWESELTTRILENLAPGEVFIDVGANMGYYSMLASRAVGPGGLVLAFEPSPPNLQLLLRNLVRNRASNVVVCGVALSDVAEVTKLWSAPYYNTGVSSLRGPEFAESPSDYHWVISTPLDEYPALKQIEQRVGIIKIDAEGLELRVLRGAEKLLRANGRLRLTCELSPQWYPPSEVVGYLESLGFSGEYYDGGWKPLTVGSPPEIQCNAWFWRG